MGTSIQVGEGDGMYRMHIHVPTENRYLIREIVEQTIVFAGLRNLHDGAANRFAVFSRNRGAEV